MYIYTYLCNLNILNINFIYCTNNCHTCGSTLDSIRGFVPYSQLVSRWRLQDWRLHFAYLLWRSVSSQNVLATEISPGLTRHAHTINVWRFSLSQQVEWLRQGFARMFVPHTSQSKRSPKYGGFHPHSTQRLFMFPYHRTTLCSVGI